MNEISQPGIQQAPKTRWQRMEDAFLISAKLLFFTMALVQYSFYVFRTLFFKDYLGLDKKKMGTLGSIMALVSFPCMTLWNTLGDLTGRHKLILALLAVSSAATFDLFMFQSSIPGAKGQFWYSAGVISCYAFFNSGMIPLLDYEGLKLLSSRPGFSKELYGRQRLWSPIAYAFITEVSAYLMKDRIGKGGSSGSGFEILFVLLPSCALVFAACLFIIAPADEPKSLREQLKKWRSSKRVATEDGREEGVENSEESRAAQPPTRSPWVVLLTNANFMFFLFVVFMNGMARMVMSNFLSLYWQNEYKMDLTQIAHATVFGIIIELIIFFYSKSFNVLGNYWMLVLAQASMVLRIGLYFILPASPDRIWQAYGIELLKGVAFALTHSASVKIAMESAPAGLEATAQALYTSMYAQFPAVFSAYTGAILYHKYGPKKLFLWTTMVSAGALIVFTIKYAFDGKIRFWPQQPAEAGAPVDASAERVQNESVSNESRERLVYVVAKPDPQSSLHEDSISDAPATVTEKN